MILVCMYSQTTFIKNVCVHVFGNRKRWMWIEFFVHNEYIVSITIWRHIWDAISYIYNYFVQKMYRKKGEIFLLQLLLLLLLTTTMRACLCCVVCVHNPGFGFFRTFTVHNINNLVCVAKEIEIYTAYRIYIML